MTKLACLMAILFAVSLASARGDEPADRKPIDWSFLRPGTTTPADVERQSGTPDLRVQRVLRKGVIDLDPRDDHAGAFGRPVRIPEAERVPVTVLEYSARRGEIADNLLIFHEERLLYAVVRPPDEEAAISDIERRHGKGHRPVRTELVVGCETMVYVAMSFDAARVAFVTEEKEIGCFECKLKLLWADPKTLAAGLAGVEWRLPEAKKKEEGAKGGGK